MTEQAKQTGETITVGHDWTVTVERDTAEVVFVSPAGAEHAVRTVADGHGKRTAVIVLDTPGTWTAADGELTATAK